MLGKDGQASRSDLQISSRLEYVSLIWCAFEQRDNRSGFKSYSANRSTSGCTLNNLMNCGPKLPTPIIPTLIPISP